MPRLRLKTRLQNLDVFATHDAAPIYRKGMRAFWLDSLFASISGAFLLTYVSLYALALGATNTQIGTLTSAASLLGMLAPIPGAQWTERLGQRKKVVVLVWIVARALSSALVFIPFFLSGEAAIYAVITIWALRAGLANLAHPAWVSLSADIVPPDRRGRYFSSRNIAMAVSSMLFVPLAGQIIDWGGGLQGYQWAFGLSTLFGFMALYWYARIPEPPPSHTGRPQRDPAAFWRVLANNRTFSFFVLIEVVWNFSLQVGGPFFTVFQVKELGSTPSMVGLMNMISSFTRILGQQFWGRIVDRRGSRWVIAACALTIPFLPFFWLFLSQPWHVLYVTIPSGFLWAGFELASFNLLLELPDPQQRTQATASYTTLIGIANIAGPLVGGWVVDTFSYGWVFALSGVGRMLGGILFVALLKPFARKAKLEG